MNIVEEDPFAVWISLEEKRYIRIPVFYPRFLRCHEERAFLWLGDGRQNFLVCRVESRVYVIEFFAGRAGTTARSGRAHCAYYEQDDLEEIRRSCGS